MAGRATGCTILIGFCRPAGRTLRRPIWSSAARTDRSGKAPRSVPSAVWLGVASGSVPKSLSTTELLVLVYRTRTYLAGVDLLARSH